MLAALGVALFGLAAMVGIGRILLDGDAVFASAHRSVAQAGGTFGVVLIVSAIAGLRGWRAPNVAVVVGAAAAASVAAYQASFGGVVFLAVLAVGVIALAGLPGGNNRIMTCLGFALMAPNILVVRQTELLEPSMRWHAYHLIVALWLGVAVVALLSARPPLIAPTGRRPQSGAVNRGL